jgi:hypothetical protein
MAGGKQLPKDVHFAAAASALAGLLSANGVTPAQAERTGALAPSDLTDLASGMTVLVSCWD